MRIRNRLRHVSDSLFERYLTFAEQNPDVVDTGEMLGKLVIFDFVYPHVANRKHDAILEVGCGHALHSCLLTGLGSVAATDLAVTETWMGDADAVRRRVIDALAERPIDFRYNDGRHLPYADGQFDVVFHNSVIEHVPDVVSFNREVRRVLKPGGTCICITGTPMLCRFRFVRYYLLRQPVLFAYNLKRTWNAARRLRSRIPAGSSVAAADIREVNVRPLLPRLFHYLRNPDYNPIVIENLAAEHGVSVPVMLESLAHQFERSPIAQLLLAAAPPTHGQHYQNVRDEARSWRLDAWAASFDAAGFEVETIEGYRLQQLLETTPSERLNAQAFHWFAPWIGVLVTRGLLPAWLATEFILVARRR